MIEAHSDSSTANGVSVATSIVLTENNYLGITTKIYYDIVQASEGELIGVIQSIKYIKSNYPDEMKFTVYCDSESIIRQCRSMLELQTVPRQIKYRDRWLEFLKESKGLDINILHQYGHQKTMNPNKVCDRLSRELLQKMRG